MVSNRIEIHSLNVGQGHATLIVTPDDKMTLIDAGHSTLSTRSLSFNTNEYIKKYIRNLEIGQDAVENLVLTHLDEDHIHNAEKLIPDLRIRSVYMPNSEYYDLDVGKVAERFVESSADLAVISEENPTIFGGDPPDGINEDPPLKGYAWLPKGSNTELLPDNLPNIDVISSIDSNANCSIIDHRNVSISILAPTSDPNQQTRNANSIILGIDYGDFSFVLPGDNTTVGRGSWIEDRSIDWMLAPHHGSKSSIDVIKKSNPKFLHISSAHDRDHAAYSHPSEEVLQFAREQEIDTTWSAMHGNTVVLASEDEIEYLTQNDYPLDPQTIQNLKHSSVRPSTIGDISRVGETRMKSLREAGYTTIEDIQTTTEEALRQVEGIADKLSAHIFQEAQKTDMETGNKIADFDPQPPDGYL